MIKVYAITVNYNRPESTEKLLVSLSKLKLDNFDFKIIVVDNGTKEEFVLKSEMDNVSVIRPGSNTGFSEGNNIGLRVALDAGADFLMLINNDTIVDSKLVKSLIKVFDKNEKVGIVSPKIYFEKGAEFHKNRYSKNELGNVIWYAGGYMDWENAKSVHRGVDEVDLGQYDTLKKIDFATGCCMMIRADLLKQIGLFDERYFLYYEDADLCLRVRNAGFEIYYEPSAFLYHENASSSGSGSPLHDYFLTRNQMIFGIENAPIKTKLALIRQSLILLISGRPKQKQAIMDYYQHKFGMGSYFDK